MKYKTTPPLRPAVTGSNGMLVGRKTPLAGLPDEDNYEIQVWEREGGEFIGYALKTAISDAVRPAWMKAIEMYPGRFLVQTNGPYVIREVTAPSETGDQFGRVMSDGSISLNELQQWYGLLGTCECGKQALVDRYAAKIQRWKSYPLREIAEKLSCTECQAAGRGRGRITLDPYKLPR